MDASEKRYFELLSQSYPNIATTAAEIARLKAMLSLPRPTEFYATDIHGEYAAFSHILRNGCGSIRRKIDAVFGATMLPEERNQLATLIYYPREKTQLLLAQAEDENAWYHVTLQRVLAVLKRVADKYTRFRVHRALGEDFALIVEELLAEDAHSEDKRAYCQALVDSTIESGRGADLIEAVCLAIQYVAVDRLHLLGDVFDRGPAPHRIMDALIQYHCVDITWGNHDIVWMGAALGQRGCIAHVVRNCARYGNLSILEDTYGINLRPLAAFAAEAYKDDPCVAFGLKVNPGLTPEELAVNEKIQKAMAIMQFKVEAQLIDEYPCFELEDRKLLHKIDLERNVVNVDGVDYELTDTVFPTVDWNDPYALTPGEEAVMQHLQQAFRDCERLQRHIKFMVEKGMLYKIENGNLLLHACVPLNEDGSMKEANIFGERYGGRALYDVLEDYIRAAFFESDPLRAKRGADLLWWMWLGEASPQFAKSKMATFEIYLCKDKAARKEVKNAFYSLRDDEQAMKGIFRNFGMDPENSRLICGHVPIKVKDGEDPVKCGGRVLCIDGGFSKAYQGTTGVAGFTIVSNSREMVLLTHEPLESRRAAIEDEKDVGSTRRPIKVYERRQLVADTDAGAEMQQQVAQLQRLLSLYKEGLLAER